MPRDKRWRVVSTVPGVMIHKMLVESFDLREDAVRLCNRLNEINSFRKFRSNFEVEDRDAKGERE